LGWSPGSTCKWPQEQSNVIWPVPCAGESCGSMRAKRILAPHFGQRGGLFSVFRSAGLNASVLSRGGLAMGMIVSKAAVVRLPPEKI
jgi:hypothetical protein